MDVAYVDQLPVPKTNAFVFTHKMHLSISLDYGHCQDSSGDSYCFELYSHCYASYGVCEGKCKEVLGLFYMYNDFFLSYHGHCCKVVMIINPNFLELTK